MSEFDFLSRMPIGQYIPTNSIVHRIDPRVKIISFLLLMVIFVISKTLFGLGLGLAYLILLIILSKIELKFVFKSVLTPLPFLIIFAVLQVFLSSSPSDPNVLLKVWRLYISTSGLAAGGILLLRFITLILTISLASYCTSTSELIFGTQRLLEPLDRIRIRTMDFVMVLQITLRFIPLIAQTAERIVKAQSSRGAEWGTKRRGLIAKVKQLLPLIVPLFVISLRRAENLALAMDARAYGYKNFRTSIMEMKFQTKDAVALLINTAAALAILFLQNLI